MSETHFSVDLSQAQLLLNRAVELLHSYPLEISVALATALLGGYTLKHLVASCNYPNIDGPQSDSFTFGNLFDIYSAEAIAFQDSLQDKYGSVSKVAGMFGKESLFVSDPRFLHEVLVKGVDVTFHHSKFFYDLNNLSFGPGLLSSVGDVHKAQRKMLNPVFTAKHMRSLVPVFDVIARNMRNSMIKDIGGAGKEIDMLRWCSATALELIGQAGMGHTFGVLEGKDSAYSHAIKEYLPSVFKVIPLKALFPFFQKLKPTALQRKLAEWAPMPYIRKLKEIIDVQDEQAHMILEQKKNNLKNGQAGISQEFQDIMSILRECLDAAPRWNPILTWDIVKANMEADEKDRLPEDQLLAQMNTLIFAGHETTSGALSRALDLLATNASIQDRLRAELLEAPTQLTYDELHNLPYLDALCREILRLYPPVPFMDREAIVDCTVPLRYPVKGKNGEEIREITVRKGTTVFVALREANRSKETWGQDADDFRPERWLKQLPASVSEAKTSGIYSSMMTFSAGPRACIGFKFSLLELKIVLSMLVKSFKFEPGNTPTVWLIGGTMAPYVAGTKDPLEEGRYPTLPLKVSVL